MQTKLIRVFAASPGDVRAERDALARAIDELNLTLGPQLSVRIELERWETHAWPGFGEDAQDVINKQISPYDIFVGIMWKRLGTPTGRAPSGTVEEFDRAYERWKAHGVPHLMFYFSNKPVPPDAREIEQLQSVLDFKRMLSEKGGFTCDYDDADSFERLVRTHLYRQITSSLEPPSPEAAGSGTSGAFDAPVPVGMVARSAIRAELHELCEKNSIVAVEGLPGTGKSFLVADLLRDLGETETALWYPASEGATLDDAITLLGTAVELTSASDLTRAKELVHHLEQESRRLVIDDFHLGDTDSFGPLLHAAAWRPPPARVLLVSRQYVELPTGGAPPARLAVGGLEGRQIAAMLERRGVPDAPEHWVRALEEKVRGLPIAIGLFASAVVEFDRDPDELLSGDLVGEDQLREWFDDLVTRLPPDSRRLLEFLSVVSGPFGRDIVREACAKLELPNAQAPFAPLQRTHLVERLGEGRWSVHQLIATLCQAQLAPEELSSINGALADHHLRQGASWRRQLLDEETFANRVAACRYLQAAERHADLETELTRLVHTAKARGHYGTFMRLCEPALKHPERDPWLDYHYAHCGLITGQLHSAATVIRRVDMDDVTDPKLRLSLGRLEAEVLIAMGEPERASRVLTAALGSYEDAHEGPVWAQASAVDARIQLELGRPDGAAEIAGALLGRAHQEHDELGAAIAFAYLGYAALDKREFRTSAENFERAASGFRDKGHRRGLAWAKAGLSRALIGLGDRETALVNAASALKIRSDIAECSPDYLSFLEQLGRDFRLKESSSLIRDELERVAGALERERTRSRRTRDRAGTRSG